MTKKERGSQLENASECSRQRIEQFLSESLSAAQEAALVEHLDFCDTCRRDLESTAAVDSTWDLARSYLTDDVHDTESLSGMYLADDWRTRHSEEEHNPRAAEITNVLSVLGPTDDPEMLGRLGPYEISGVVGAGGMGIVLKGYDLALDRVVAIKVLAPHLATSGSARKRFAREAKAAAAVLHPNVMLIHGVDNEGALPFLVMPYMRGASLQKRIDDQGRLSPVEILRVASQIASGLAAAHAQGLVHRDIKPANIMLADGLEQVAITDFGLARAADDATMTRSGVIAGTPQYMSPEQTRGEPIDGRSDLFSLGSLIYAMCVGHSPFRAETSYGVLKRVNDDRPRSIREINPEIPTWLCRLVDLLHHKDREDRIESASDVEALLTQCLAHMEQPQTCELPETLLSKPSSFGSAVLANGRVGTLRFLLAACVALLLIAVAGSLYNYLPFFGEKSSAGRMQEEPGESTEAKERESFIESESMDGQTMQIANDELERLWNEMDDDFEVLRDSSEAINATERLLDSEFSTDRNNDE